MKIKCDAANCDSFINDICNDSCEYSDRRTGKICEHGNPRIHKIIRLTPELRGALEVSKRCIRINIKYIERNSRITKWMVTKRLSNRIMAMEDAIKTIKEIL